MLILNPLDLRKKADILVIPVCEDRDIHDAREISGMVKSARTMKEFNAKKGNKIILYHMPGIKTERVLFLGLGRRDTIDTETLRQLAGKAVQKSMKRNFSDIDIVVPSPEKIKIPMDSMLEALMEGAHLANYIFDTYKKEKKTKALKTIRFLVNPSVKKDNIKKFSYLPEKITAICDGTILAREWVTLPPNDKRPEQLTRSIISLAKKENIRVTVFNENDLKRKKFGAILAVASGSTSRPRLVMLKYSPAGAKRKIALVGKGVTFDSGGINLKTGPSLEDMKCDMSGAAAVAATLITIAKLKLKVNVTAFIPIVENMPSGSAARPGDIIRSYDGKTIEIGNTDAEGRLILIDAMSYAVKTFKPDIMIDMATLTGACVIALGEKIAGVFSSEDNLADAIITSGEKTFERCWRMPLPDDYKDLIKSDLADIKNLASARWGGAITAALFLSEFVGDTRWAHIDIAGPAFAKKGNSYCTAGGTGFGVRLLCDVIQKL